MLPLGRGIYVRLAKCGLFTILYGFLLSFYIFLGQIKVDNNNKVEKVHRTNEKKSDFGDAIDEPAVKDEWKGVEADIKAFGMENKEDQDNQEDRESKQKEEDDWKEVS